MAASNKELTHDEVWDDSALIDSWNEALNEYKASPPPSWSFPTPTSDAQTWDEHHS